MFICIYIQACVCVCVSNDDIQGPVKREYFQLFMNVKKAVLYCQFEAFQRWEKSNIPKI